MKGRIYVLALGALVAVLALGCAQGFAMRHGGMCEGKGGCQQACLHQRAAMQQTQAQQPQPACPSHAAATMPRAGGSQMGCPPGCPMAGGQQSMARGQQSMGYAAQAAMSARFGTPMKASAGMGMGCPSATSAGCPDGKMERTRRIPDPAGWGYIERPVRRHHRDRIWMHRGGENCPCGGPCCRAGMSAPAPEPMQRGHRRVAPYRGGMKIAPPAPVPPAPPAAPAPPPPSEHHE
ncbi:MAG: hypothetical protein ACE15D_13540 [Candidatus Eisenbacteria bacterium]